MICEQLYLKKKLSIAWDWFVGLNGGLRATLLCLKRHPDLSQDIVAFLKEIGKQNLLELFTSYLKNDINDDKQYLFIMTRLFEPMFIVFPEEELLNSGILEKWIDFALIFSESPTSDPENKIESICFLTEVWLLFPHFFENEESKAINLINSFKKACKESSTCAYVSIVNLLRLLETFGKNKDPYAPMIYKILTFLLIENANYLEIRSLIMNNMMVLFIDLESIPLSIMIEPWVKHIQVSGNNENISYQWNIIDFEFLRFISIQEKLTIKNAIQIVDILSKILLNDHIYSIFAHEIMLILIKRFLDNETMQEFLNKLTKRC